MSDGRALRRPLRDGGRTPVETTWPRSACGSTCRSSSHAGLAHPGAHDCGPSVATRPTSAEALPGLAPTDPGRPDPWRIRSFEDYLGGSPAQRQRTGGLRVRLRERRSIRRSGPTSGSRSSAPSAARSSPHATVWRLNQTPPAGVAVLRPRRDRLAGVRDPDLAVVAGLAEPGRRLVRAPLVASEIHAASSCPAVSRRAVPDAHHRGRPAGSEPRRTSPLPRDLTVGWRSVSDVTDRSPATTTSVRVVERWVRIDCSPPAAFALS